MIQFDEKEQEEIRYRGRRYPRFIKKLKDSVYESMEGKPMVPKTGIADWVLYYYCPDCSVSLIFDRKSPDRHICPCCKKSFTGEPYDGAWWGLINGQNYRDAFIMAVIWMASGEDAYARRAADLLAEYARNYPNYEVHGNIPYNGPGRSGAQTLDEANFLRSFAMTYDILSDYMSEEERELVRDNMLLPGAAFLLEHRHKQLHNHEVIINSAVAVIGILFSREDYVEEALYEKYGLIYQLEHGVLENHLWFEGTFGYHFYALQSFMAFEKFARHTAYSNIRHPNYRYMLESVFDYLRADGSVPMMNDTNYGHFSRMKPLYEFAYRELGGEKLAYILNTAYWTEKRDNLESFLYGVDELPRVILPLQNYHTGLGKSGYTILRGRDDRYLLFKHDNYGGEHDHYDRLGISFYAYGQPIARDLGTTGYGAKLHYDYYKNTGTHNTMVIGEENQAPVAGKLTRYEEIDNVVYVEAEADWTAPYHMPDTFTIRQWSEENYRTVTMRRKIAWTDSYFVEVFLAEQIPEGKTADWVFHVSGRTVSEEDRSFGKEIKKAGLQREITTDAPEKYFEKKPFCYLKDVKLTGMEKTGSYQRTYQRTCGETENNVFTTIFGMKNGQTFIESAGPDNPSKEEISYIIERREYESACFAHVIESWKEEPVVNQVGFKKENGQLEITVTETDGAERKFVFSVR